MLSCATVSMKFCPDLCSFLSRVISRALLDTNRKKYPQRGHNIAYMTLSPILSVLRFPPDNEPNNETFSANNAPL